jgi:T5orf172 domain
VRGDSPMPNRRRKCRPRAAPRGGPAGEVVYFVRAGNAVKIGSTTNLAARLRALATASAVSLELLAAVPGGREVEARLHRHWRHLHVQGEWFRADEALVRYAREQAAGPAPPTPAEATRAAELGRVLAALGPRTWRRLA